jgi:hypothetical protein
MTLPFLALLMMLNFNEHPAFNWPSVRTLDAVTLASKKTARDVRVELTSYCLYNHPSLRTGTVLRAKARVVEDSAGEKSVEFRSTSATMRDGREITFAERKWKAAAVYDRERRAYVVSKGTELMPHAFESPPPMRIAAR